MIKLILGAFPNLVDGSEAMVDFELAHVPSEDILMIAREKLFIFNEQDNMTNPLLGQETQATTGSAMIIDDDIVGGPLGDIADMLVKIGIPHEAALWHEQVLTSDGMVLGINDTVLDEQEIRQCFAEHGALYVAAIKSESLTAPT